MKYFASVLLLFSTLISQEQTPCCEEIAVVEEPSRSLWDYHPLHIGGNAIYIGEAEIKHDGTEFGSLRFNKANAFLFMLLPISAETYFFPRVEWNRFTMHWSENPFFDQTHFYYLQFGLMMYSIALENWRWIMRVDYNMDTRHFSKAGLYGLTSGLLWGSYKIHRKWHYHVGATGYFGLEGTTIYPIIGADYAPNKKWLFQMIFPFSYFVQYRWRDWCKVAIKGRPLKERFRVGKHQPLPQSIFNYSSMGAELNVVFERKDRLEVELFGGYNAGGKFYIKDRDGHHPYYTKVGGAPYVGLNVDYAF